MTQARTSGGLAAIVTELQSAVGAKKCHRCGCFRSATEQFRAAAPQLPAEAQERLLPVIAEGEQQLEPSQYDCLGCAICWPANALNRATEAWPESPIAAEDSCPTDIPAQLPGWPSYPGNYRVLDAAADVAVCVLTSEDLVERIAAAHPKRVGIIGGVYTENLGLERIIANVAGNPNLTTLVVCGADSQQRIGHLPGQSLLSLVANGLDERSRIIGAEGRRPVLKNVSPELVRRFREEVEVLGLIGEEDPDRILRKVEGLPVRPRRAALQTERPPAIRAASPDRLILDPKGYFVLFPDRARGVVVVEHYENAGTLAHAFEGERSDQIYATILAHELVSRLDHAAYLGQELARACRSLETGEPYIQDQAPEPACDPGCGCHSPGDVRKESA